MSRAAIGCLVLPVAVGRKGAVEVGVSPLPPLAPGGEGGGERGEAVQLEEKRGRGERASSSSPVLSAPLLLRQGRDLFGADQWSVLAALSARVVGAGAVLPVRPLSLWHLVDGRQLLAGIFIIIVLFLHVYLIVVGQNWEGI